MEKGNPPPYSPSAPPAGFVVPGPQGYYPAQSNPPIHPHGEAVHTVVPVQQPAQVVVYTGNCPKCHVGNLQKEYCTCCGVFWAIVLFPIGLLCLFCCSKQACSHCGHSRCYHPFEVHHLSPVAF